LETIRDNIGKEINEEVAILNKSVMKVIVVADFKYNHIFE